LTFKDFKEISFFGQKERNSVFSQTMKRIVIVLVIVGCSFCPLYGQDEQHSVAREWNELLLLAIRSDFARPTVHARNLFHISAAMYDAWAVYDDKAETFFLNRTLNDFYFPFEGIELPEDRKAAQEEAISYAALRLIEHRFAQSPRWQEFIFEVYAFMLEKGYPTSFTSPDYSSGSPAALGNYIAAKVIEFGKQDGSNELDTYANQYYTPKNYVALDPTKPGNPDMVDPNRWQALQLGTFIDQGGNPIPGNIIPFLSPEWGQVVPFSLTSDDLTIHERDGHEWWVYHDPGPPAYLDANDPAQTAAFVWSFSLVATWSSHLDPADSVKWDISPGASGNIPFSSLPVSYEEYPEFYNLLEGGDPGLGYDLNPATGIPYEPQWVPRGDYTRALAEFWADGPSSETPPGHWFTILNYVSDHPLLEKRWGGEGDVMDDLEWDVKSYFILGGALHDVAIAAWGIKGYYDYVRPVSAIRWLSELGQSSDPQIPNYHPGGFKLYEGFIELVKSNDPLVGANKEHLHKVKVKSWKGPQYIGDPATQAAGVDWVLAENWWPYQRPTFVTPPFAGYISGHSTYSRAAAEVLTLITGSEYFPGGMGEFDAAKNEFLVFEEGPSTDVVLQWAKYADASDQCSLSRIWGGIHPPMDDIPGRIIGHDIGIEAFNFGTSFFDGVKTGLSDDDQSQDLVTVFPNPLRQPGTLQITPTTNLAKGVIRLMGVDGVVRNEVFFDTGKSGAVINIDCSQLKAGMYLLQVESDTRLKVHRIVIE